MLWVVLYIFIPIIARTQPQTTTSFNFECAPPPPIDLDIYDGLMDWITYESYSGGHYVVEELEESIGAITLANLNDTDGDEMVDNEDSSVKKLPTGRNEIDLMRLVVNKPTPDVGGAVNLKIISGFIVLWESPSKETLVQMSNDEIQIQTSNLPVTYYIEAFQPSLNLRDIEIKASYNNSYDIVNATAIWTQETGSQYTPYYKYRCEDENDPHNNPSAASLDIVDNGGLIDRIDNKYISECGSRYGYGTCAKTSNSTPKDQVIGGRILYEFEIFPDEITEDPLYADRVFFDLTRQRHNHKWNLESGKHNLVDSGENYLFPIDQNPVKDIETPNDDDTSVDEDNMPDNGKIYQWDAPTIPISMTYPTYYGIIYGFIIKKATFHDFARFMLGNSGVNPFDVDNSPTPVQGSACSKFYNWSMIQYTKNENGNFVVDDEEVSHSTPVFNNGSGPPYILDPQNGSINIQVDPLANTEGYTATYDASIKRWNAVRSSNNSNYNSTGTGPWIIEIPSQVLITITPTNFGFPDGSNFSFSTFRTQENIYGKVNFINTEPFEYIDIH